MLRIACLRRSAMTLVLLVWGSFAAAGQLDDYYLAKFAGLYNNGVRSAQLATSQPGVPVERCLTPLHHDLRRDWKQLAATTQTTLAKFLARPALSGEAVVRSNGGHFYIHYATSGSDAPPLTDSNGNGIPDWVETVANVFEAVYNREVNVMGFKSPPTSGGNPYDVYLQNVGAQGYFGVTESDVTVPPVAATSFITIDNDFSVAEFGGQIVNYTPEKALGITAAHEFHHAIQFGYSFYFEAWYAEATSTWMEDEVYDSVNQSYAYFPPYLQYSTLPLDSAVSVATGGGYGRWLFNRYLNEVFPTTPMIRNIWERLATKPAPTATADIPIMRLINEVLQDNGSSLSSVFLGFTRRMVLRNWASHQNEISLIRSLPVLAADVYTVTSDFTAPAISLSDYAFKIVNVMPSASSVSLLITYPGKPTTNVAQGFLKSNGGTFTEAGYDAGTGTLTLPGFVTGATAYLLMCNNTTGSTVVPAEPSQAIATLADATNPFNGSPVLVSSSNGSGGSSGAPAAGGGGGGGCFIATAAYGSYLHPKVQVLRDFREKYLLTNLPGRVLVASYYRLSPPVARIIANHEGLRGLVRVILAPIVWSLEHKVQGIVGALFVLLAGCLRFGMKSRVCRRS